MKQLETHRVLSEQDYGPWLDAATLYEDGNRLVLKIEGGYRKPYDAGWYVLASRPARPLAELLPGTFWSDASRDQSDYLTEELGVAVEPLHE